MDKVIYRLPIKESLRTAWAKVHGAKASIWAAIVIMAVAIIILGAIDDYLQHRFATIEPSFYIVDQIIIYLFQIGLLYLGIQRAQDMPIHYRLVFRGYEKSIILKAIGLYVLQFLIVLIPILVMLIGVLFSPIASAVSTTNPHAVSKITPAPITSSTILLIILFIIGFVALVYLTVRLSLSLGFVVDKKAGPWQAIKLSFAASRFNIWRLIALYLLQMVIILISLIPIGIGLIWSLPFAFILYGVIYQNLSLHNLDSPPLKTDRGPSAGMA